MLAVVLLGAVALAPGSVARAAGPQEIAVATDRVEVRTQLGRTFTVRTTIRNDGSGDSDSLIAHLNVLSAKPGTYVDPEDWSAERTVYVEPLAPGRSRVITWTIQAISTGTFAVYASVLPRSGLDQAPVAGPAVAVVVADRETLDAGGILPLAILVPALVGLATLGVRVSRRRR